MLHAQTTTTGSFNGDAALGQSTQPDSIVQLAAESQGLELVAAADVPRNGTFWCVTSNGLTAPYPCAPLDPNVPVYQIVEGQFLVDETGGQVSQSTSRFGMQAASSTVASTLAAQYDAVVNLINQIQEAEFNREFARAFGFEDEFNSLDSFATMAPLYDPAGLWLEITNVSNSVSYFSLHNATNQVYAIWTTTDISGGWQVEMELWPTNSEVMPFTLPTMGRENLFVRAEDWTGKDSNGDGIPDWWIWKYFGDLPQTATNLDVNGIPLLYDYLHGINPLILGNGNGMMAFTNGLNISILEPKPTSNIP